MNLWQRTWATYQGELSCVSIHSTSEEAGNEWQEFLVASGIPIEQLGLAMKVWYEGHRHLFDFSVSPEVACLAGYMAALLIWQAYEENRLRPALEGSKDETQS